MAEIAAPYAAQTWSMMTWYGVEFICYLCIIAYVLAYFGLIKSPKQTANVVENTNQTWAATGDLLSNAASIAKRVNSALTQPSPEAPPAAPSK
jgi:hypothetical protein